MDENAQSTTPDSSVHEKEVVPAKTGLGIGLLVLSIGMFVSMDAVIKHTGELGYSTIQIIFFRNAVAFVPITLLVLQQGGLSSLRTSNPAGHVIRSLVGLTAMGCFFYAVRELPLSDLIAITFAAPLFMTALSVPLLKEKVGARRWAAVVIGFVGVLVMVKPSGSFQTASLIAIGGTVFYALAMIAVRNLSKTESSSSIVFYFTVVGTIVSGGLLFGDWQQPDATGWKFLIAVGLIGGTAQIVMTWGIKYTPIAILAPFEYTALLWASGFDIMIWNVFPAPNTLWGALVVAATGLYILHRETRLNVRARFPARFTRTRVSSSERDGV